MYIFEESNFNVPTLAGLPPTILVFVAFEYPHPSFGVSKRPRMSEPKCKRFKPRQNIQNKTYSRELNFIKLLLITI